VGLALDQVLILVLLLRIVPLFVIRQFCPVEVEILVREADIVGPP